MMNMADPDPSYSVPCMHCAALLQHGVRICPFCGKDQSAVLDIPDAKPTSEPERAPSRGTARAPMDVVDFADTVQPEQHESLGYPIPTTAAANDESDPEIGLVRPGAFWQEEVLGDGSSRRHWAGSSILPIRLVISVLAAGALVGIALLIDNLYLDNESEAGRQREFKANVEQVQSALNRGDFGVAARVLEELETDHADDPGVEALRDAFDRRLQEQSRREQLRDAAQKASKAIGISGPVTPPAQVQSQVPPQRRDSAQEAIKALGLGEPATPQAPAAPAAAQAAAQTPTPAPPEPKAAAPVSAQGAGTADSKEKDCNGTLAALALCQK
jgi:hypothetical protein